MSYIKFIPSSKNIIKAQQTIGSDEAAFVLLYKQNLSKAKPIKAMFGKKKIKLKHLINWEQIYQKVNI